MVHIAICDDDYKQSQKTEKLILEKAERFSPETELFSDGTELIKAVKNGGYTPDLAVLDIHMPGNSGIDVAKTLNLLVPECNIIFLTSFLGYATEVYETRHSYFILKSELEERIDAAMTKVLADRAQELRIRFREGRVVQTVTAAEVLYLERILKKTAIVLCSGKKHFTTAKAEELLKDFPADRFAHCHQSFWVNVEKITGMKTESFSLINGEEIPISRSRKKEAKDAFFAQLERQTEH